MDIDSWAVELDKEVDYRHYPVDTPDLSTLSGQQRSHDQADDKFGKCVKQVIKLSMFVLRARQPAADIYSSFQFVTYVTWFVLQ